MNPDFTLIWPLSCLKDGDHLSGPLLGQKGVLHATSRAGRS